MEGQGPDPAAFARALALAADPTVATGLRVQALEEGLLGLLRDPGLAEPTVVAAVATILPSSALEPKLCERALHLLAGLLYVAPMLVDEATVVTLTRLLGSPGLHPSTRRLALDVFSLTAATPGAPAIPAAIRELLADPHAGHTVQRGLITLVGFSASYLNELMSLEDAIALAGAAHMAPFREFFLSRVIERLAFVAPDSFTPARFARLRTLYRRQAAFRYLAYYVAGRSETPPETALVATSLARRRFPLHGVVRARLGRGAPRVLVVHNVTDGQGDELVRVGPLTQALLDFQERLRVTVVTRRTYLYEHPRVVPVAVEDAGAVDAALREPFDVVVHFHEPLPGNSYRQELDPLLGEYVRTRRPFLHVTGRKEVNRFLYETVTVDGEPWIDRLALSRPRGGGVYEPLCRLVAELGLPLRAGENLTPGGALFAAEEWPVAAAEWSHLVQGAQAPAGPRRPVALVNPFGGGHPLKGYVLNQFGALARELSGLAAEGFFLVLLPNGTPWGTGELAAEIVSRLPPAVRPLVTVAPDPGPATGADRERADHTIRLFKHFVRYADLVVTVEGWMMHLAYQLGRPCRTVGMAYSLPDWYPHGASRTQGLVPTMSPLTDYQASMATGTTPLDEPVTPAYPRRAALRIALRGLAEPGDPLARALLLRSAGNPDIGVRAAAIEALIRHPGPQVEATVRAGLRDKATAVRAAVAKALLATPRLREQFGEDATTLRCHVWIQAQRWKEVAGLGRGALRALAVAAEDSSVTTRHIAQGLFWSIVGGLPDAARGAGPEREPRALPEGRASEVPNPQAVTGTEP